MQHNHRQPVVLLLLAALLLGGCGGGESGHGHGHVHKAPHDGTLVELGNHEFNLELVHDEAAGTLAAYVLGAHAERHLQIEQPSIAINLKAGAETHELELKAVADELTKETVGDTSHFSAQSEWLKKHGISGTVVSVTIKGSTYTKVSFDLDAHHGHAQ